MLLFLKSIISDNQPPSLWLFDFVPQYTLILLFISGKLTWHKKFIISLSPLNVWSMR